MATFIIYSYMTEIIDFIIELLYSINGGLFSYKKRFQSAIEVPQDDKNVLINRLTEHLKKDPATANLKFSYIYIDRSMRGMKMIILDEEYRKIHSIMFSDFLDSKWKTGKIEYQNE